MPKVIVSPSRKFWRDEAQSPPSARALPTFDGAGVDTGHVTFLNKTANSFRKNIFQVAVCCSRQDPGEARCFEPAKPKT